MRQFFILLLTKIVLTR